MVKKIAQGHPTFLERFFQTGGGQQNCHRVEGAEDVFPEEEKTQGGMSHVPWGIADTHEYKLKGGTL